MNRWQQRRLLGLCMRCKQPAIAGLTLCQKHREKGAEARKKRADRLKNASQCVVCASPAAIGRTLCHKHLAEQASRTLKKYEERQANGLCVDCSEPAFPGMSRCVDHLAKDAQVRAQRKQRAEEQGICMQCFYKPRASDQVRACQACLDNMKRDRQQAFDAGICRRCRQTNPTPDHTRCPDCRLYETLQLKEKRPGGHYIETMERDGYRCCLCHQKEHLLIHHIDGSGTRPLELVNNEPSNLLVLCRKCHSPLESLLRRNVDPAMLAQLIRRESIR